MSAILDPEHTPISQCSIMVEGNICMPEETLEELKQILPVAEDKQKSILELAAEETGCETEECILNHYRNDISNPDYILQKYYKIVGPTDKSLLNNINIDETLKQWGLWFPDFYPYNFNMRNFTHYSWRDGYVINRPDTLATVSPVDLYNKGYRTAACVINTDTYQGPGKHWIALFVDMRNPVFTIEVFNSSGNDPPEEFLRWMVDTKKALTLFLNELKDKNKNKEVKIVKASGFAHQFSMTECGVYSLFYIYCRLKKIKYTWFLRNRVSDRQMFAFRQHLFGIENELNRKNKDKYLNPDNTFNWEKFKKIIQPEFSDY